MILGAVSIWAFAILIVLMVLLSIEIGFRVGRGTRAKMAPGSEPPIVPISGAVLGLLGFVLAFTFSIVYSRYEARKDLVRQEANAIIRVWMRSDFMSEPYRSQSVSLLKKYVDLRLAAVEAANRSQIQGAIDESQKVQKELWDLAIAAARKDGIGGLAAPYIMAINDLIDIHGRRLAIGVEDRIPFLIWFSLLTLLLIGMSTMGFLTAMKNTKRSPLTNLLALAFCIVFLVISALDNPYNNLFTISQKPMIYAKTRMSE